MRARSWASWTATLAVLAMVSSCTASATSDATPSPTGPYPAAVIAPLTPAEVADGPHEDHPAVQAVRTADVIMAWANLIDTPKFAQFTQYIDPASEPNVIGYAENSTLWDWFAIGPWPSEIVSVTDKPDGSAVVRACHFAAADVSKETGDARDMSGLRDPILIDATVSPLTESEVAGLRDLGLDPPQMWVREYKPMLGVECDASAATVQQFENWREYAPVGEYLTGVESPEPVTDEGYAQASPLAGS